MLRASARGRFDGTGLALKSSHLRKAAEFRLVYERGRRFEGRLLTVFVLENTVGCDRIGVTVSRKIAKSAVLRNRAKRLLRESFRLSHLEREQLENGYDWVLNARRTLLATTVAAPLNEFRRVISELREREARELVKA